MEFPESSKIIGLEPEKKIVKAAFTNALTIKKSVNRTTRS